MLSPLALSLIKEFDQESLPNNDRKISVNPVVAEVASFYEKIRNSLDLREDEGILCATIERILRRRLLLNGRSEKVAPALIRELVWARYFPDNSVPESIVNRVATRIEIYQKLYDRVSLSNFDKNGLSGWFIGVMSADIASILLPGKDNELLENIMFYLLKDKVTISDDSEEARDIQIFTAIHRAFAKEELSVLRFHLFQQFFGLLTEGNFEDIAQNFLEGYQQIEKSLHHPLQDRIYSYVKKQTAPFFILREVLQINRGENQSLIENPEKLRSEVSGICSLRYKDISTRVKRAITRSIIFLLVTKALFALAVEGSFESIFYGSVMWKTISINTMIPPTLMLVSSFFIKTPGKDNTEKINDRIHSILYQGKYGYSEILALTIKSQHSLIMEIVFTLLWMVAAILGFGGVVFILLQLHFNYLSMGVFLFFLAIVSFLAYRINQTARLYTVETNKQNVSTILFDFLFMPFIQVGMKLAKGISQLNIVLYIFDFIIEAPFKGIFSFFETWFYHLHIQREKLG